MVSDVLMVAAYAALWAFGAWPIIKTVMRGYVAGELDPSFLDFSQRQKMRDFMVAIGGRRSVMVRIRTFSDSVFCCGF
jgi:hypothetical protein